MRLHFIIAAGVVLAPLTAFAQEATPVAPSAPVAASAAPMPGPGTDGQGMNGYRALAIAAGAIVGIAVVEWLSGGTITPVLVAGGPAMAVEPAAAVAPAAAGAVAEPVAAVAPAGYGYGYSFLEVVKVAAGAVIGGNVGNWLYMNSK